MDNTVNVKYNITRSVVRLISALSAPFPRERQRERVGETERDRDGTGEVRERGGLCSRNMGSDSNPGQLREGVRPYVASIISHEPRLSAVYVPTCIH